MLPLLKKNPDKARANLAPGWHTNFRNYALLPDTKIIRTSFFINALYFVVLIGAVVACGFQEYKIRTLQSEISVWQGRIDSRQQASNEAVALYKKFQVEEKKILDLDAFRRNQKVAVSDFIIVLGRSLPQGVVLTTIDYKDTASTIRGYVEGSSEQASGIASEFEKLLRDNKQINTVYPFVNLSNLARDQQANRLLFEIGLRSVAPTEKKK